MENSKVQVLREDRRLCTTIHVKGPGKGQDAQIHLVNGEFTKCDYHVSSLSYSLDDWKWLGELSKMIQSFDSLEKELMESSGLKGRIDKGDDDE